MLLSQDPMHQRRGAEDYCTCDRPWPCSLYFYEQLAVKCESTGNAVSGIGRYGLANQLWSLAEELRRKADG